jgi:hypothetical protein
MILRTPGQRVKSSILALVGRDKASFDIFVEYLETELENMTSILITSEDAQSFRKFQGAAQVLRDLITLLKN